MCPFWAKQAELSWGGYTAEKIQQGRKQAAIKEKKLKERKKTYTYFPCVNSRLIGQLVKVTKNS